MSLPAGNYQLVCVGNTSLALDVSGAGAYDGCNVQVHTRNYTDAQVWSLRYRSDGTAKIVSRFCGKCLDLRLLNITQGGNITIHTDNNSNAQKWDIVETGRTVQVGGESYDAYYITLHGYRNSSVTSGRWVVECYGTGTPSSGTNICIAGDEGTSSDQWWVFLPIDPFRSGGVYEIRSKMNTNMCADVAYASKANGANVMLHACNHGNNQKWVLTNEGNGWSVRSVGAGKYMDVAGSFRDGTNVQTWQDNDTRAQRWKVTPFGTMSVGGETCQVVTLGAGNGSAYVLDSQGAVARNWANLMIHAPNQGDNQRWVLFPTWAEDEFMPSPHSLGAAASVGSTKNGGNTEAWGSSMTFHLVPMWICAPSYATGGPNGYQIRKRTRLMSASRSTWGSWSSWSSWSTAGVTRKGQRHWLTEGYDLSMSSAYKLAQLEFEVRSTGVDELVLLHGASVSKCVTCYPVPDVTFPAAGWSPSGIRLQVESSYSIGQTVLNISSIKLGGKNILSKPMSFGKLDDATSVLIGQDMLNGFPEDGATLRIAYTLGTDQAKRLSGSRTASVSVSYDSGSASGTPTLTPTSGHALLATVPNLGNSHMWVCYGDVVRECAVSSSNASNTNFEVLYPFGKAYTLFVTGFSSDGDDWFTWHVDLVGAAGPWHVWNMEDGFAEVEAIANGAERSNMKLAAVYEAAVLDSRPFETVSFAATRKSSYTATGMLSTSDVSDFEDLVGEHALWRSAAGDYCDVAVTEVSAQSKQGSVHISVSMIREA